MINIHASRYCQPFKGNQNKQVLTVIVTSLFNNYFDFYNNWIKLLWSLSLTLLCWNKIYRICPISFFSLCELFSALICANKTESLVKIMILKSLNYNHGHNMMIIFDVFNQTFFSPQKKRSLIFSNKLEYTSCLTSSRTT